jgi:hypothetical protein
MAQGKLAQRSAALPYVDPNIDMWLPHVPNSFFRLAQRMYPVDPPSLPGAPPEVAPDVVRDFDAAAHRRSLAAQGPRNVAGGWAYGGTNKEVAAIQIADASGAPMRTQFTAIPRPDVTAGKPGLQALGFEIDWPISYPLNSLRYRIVFKDGDAALSPPISAMPLSTPLSLSPPGAVEPIYLAIEKLQQPQTGRRAPLIAKLNQLYPGALSAFFALSILAALWSILMRGVSAPALAALLFVGATIVSRLLFFAILDASAWNGDQTRYTLSVAVLSGCVPALLFVLGRKSAPTTPASDKPLIA